jgi:hypothetical protein
MSTKKDYVVGSGNVFADLRVPHPEEALAKAELAHEITKRIAAQGPAKARLSDHDVRAAIDEGRL